MRIEIYKFGGLEFKHVAIFDNSDNLIVLYFSKYNPYQNQKDQFRRSEGWTSFPHKLVGMIVDRIEFGIFI